MDDLGDGLKDQESDNVVGRELFETMLDFARQVQKATDEPLETTLRTCTPLGHWFHSPEQWKNYLDGLDSEKDPLRRAVRLMDEPQQSSEHMEFPAFGSFTFDYTSNAINIHFGREPQTVSPLSKEKVPERIQDLRDMFAHIKENFPDAKEVRGWSWLYNLEAYKRLLPPSYVASIQPDTNPENIRGDALWAQFLDHRHHVKPEMYETLKKNLERSGPNDILSLFPFQIMTAHAPIQDFYDFYNIK